MTASAETTASPSAKPPLGIIAGGGTLPLRVAQAARMSGRAVFVVALRDFCDPVPYAGIPHVEERIGAAQRIVDALKAARVQQVVLAGKVKRPSMFGLMPDPLMAKLLLRIGTLAFAGDDGLLRAAVQAVEEQGFTVLPAQAVLTELLPEAGLLAGPAPDDVAERDILRGIAVAQALGAADVGQAVVVQQGLVLGVEAIEGTDALLARCAGLQREGPAGVLVKISKPGQDHRVDLPTIGITTIEGVAAAGLRGIAIEAGATILLDRPAVLAAAAQAGIFILAWQPNRHQEGQNS